MSIDYGVFIFIVGPKIAFFSYALSFKRTDSKV